MANNSIQTRFTEQTYATKQEVIHELKTPLIDSFWKMIVTYRQQFFKPLGVHEIDRSPINYCACPAINNKIEDCSAKLFELSNKFGYLSEDGNDRFIYKKDSMVEVLGEIAKKNNLEVDEKLLSMIIGNSVTVDSQYDCLKRYVNAIELLKTRCNDPVNEDLLAELYQCVSGVEELVGLYRENDLEARKFDRYFVPAPAGLVPGLMAELLDALNDDNLHLIVKSALAYYFIAYVKPFNDNNEEIAALLAKLILDKNDATDVPYSINIEKIVNEHDEKFLKVCAEVQRNNDFTYFLDMFMKLVSDSIEKEISRMNNLEALALKKEYYAEDLKEAKESAVYQELVEQGEVSEDVIETIEEVSAPEVVEEIPTAPARTLDGLAISVLPPVLDEKECQRLEEFLLETDPELKRSQAYFYARHCTMGKRYTIGQFKKELGCAYETARTSMDSLAALGYYRQEMVKNKKVYTPIKRN